jgi:hypothetical protein
MVSKQWMLGLATAAILSVAGGSSAQAASAATDDAGNYTPATFVDTANAGTGFGPWAFELGEGATIDLGDSSEATGNLNSTNDLAFLFLGGTNGSFAGASRAFNAPLIPGDTFTATIAYNWNGGARGLNILDASNNELLNVNYGGADALSYTLQGSTGIDVATDYVSTATVTIAVTQLADNALDITLTRNDGFTTNIVSGSLSGPATAFRVYNGGHAGDSLNYALFLNNLAITESTIPTLSLSGRDAMAVGMTNELTVTRGGLVATQAVVAIANSDPAASDVPATVTLADGDAVTNFPIAGLALGASTITVTSEGFPTSSLAVAVYDLGYDDSSYAASAFTNNGNSGLGFLPWILQDNAGEGVGFTNFAGTFIGESTGSGGGNVNASSGDAFGLFANQDGTGGDPFVNAIRPFANPLAPGQVVSLEIGVNFRNGSKGVAFQNSGSTIFEVGVFADDYWYINPSVTNEPVSLGWAYAADTAIVIELAKVSATLYDITIIRRGSTPETNALGTVDLGTVAPNEVRFYAFNTEAGGENNIFFNRLALYSGNELVTLALTGNDNLLAGTTNLFTVTRSGPVDAALTVDVESDNAGVATVPASVEIPAGSNDVTFAVVAIANGFATLDVSETSALGASFEVDVYDLGVDDSTYYPPALFEDGGNGGNGFSNWVITANAGPGDGFTNFAGVFLGSSAAVGNVNGSDGEAFGLFANSDGNGDALSEATRAFETLDIGQSFTVTLGVNFRNGAKGLMLQNGGTWLFEVAVFNDDYWYNVRDTGDNPVSLGWTYAADTAIEVIFSRTGANSYNVQFIREGSVPESTLIEGITLSQAPDRARFYVFNTDAGDANNLYVNDLARFTGTVGQPFTDGIPNAWWDLYNIPEIDRVAANDLDIDGASNLEEFIADTNPDDIASVFPNLIDAASGEGVLALQTGPTTNSRVYDIWWTTNLTAAPQSWTRLGVSTPGNGGDLTLIVTNDVPARIYRTGVALP